MAEILTEKSEKAIGVFDSGMGGLTCVAEIMKLMPNENIIYFPTATGAVRLSSNMPART